MSVLSDLRIHPRTGAVDWRVMDAEYRLVQELDNYSGLYGFQLQDRPRQGFITVEEADTDGASFTLVTTNPTAGQVYVDYNLGFCLFNVIDNGKNIVVNYQGAGSNANIENLQSLASVPTAAGINALASKTTPVDNDALILRDSVALDVKKLLISNLSTKVKTDILSLGDKSTIVDGDKFFIKDSEDSNTGKFFSFEALENILVPVGSIRPIAYRTADAGNLMCNGSAVSRSTYANLFTKISPLIGSFTVTIATPAVVTLSGHGFFTGDSVYLTTTGALPTGLTANTLYYVIEVNSTTFRLATSRANARAGTAINTTGSQSGVHSLYHCPFGLGDGSTTFNLPDFTGGVPSGAGLSTGYTQNITRVLGEKQDDAMQGHWHNIASSDGTAGSEKLLGNSSYGTSRTNNQTLENGARTIVTDGTNGTPRTANETRMKNVAVYWQIKY